MTAPFGSLLVGPAALGTASPDPVEALPQCAIAASASSGSGSLRTTPNPPGKQPSPHERRLRLPLPSCGGGGSLSPQEGAHQRLPATESLWSGGLLAGGATGAAEAAVVSQQGPGGSSQKLPARMEEPCVEARPGDAAVPPMGVATAAASRAAGCRTTSAAISAAAVVAGRGGGGPPLRASAVTSAAPAQLSSESQQPLYLEWPVVGPASAATTVWHDLSPATSPMPKSMLPSHRAPLPDDRRLAGGPSSTAVAVAGAGGRPSSVPEESEGGPSCAGLLGDKSVMNCRHWKSKGFCKLGDACKFQHPAHALKELQEIEAVVATKSKRKRGRKPASARAAAAAAAAAGTSVALGGATLSPLGGLAAAATMNLGDTETDPANHASSFSSRLQQTVNLGSDRQQVAQAVGVAPLVVVPADDLDEVVVEGDGGAGVEDGRARVADDVR